MNREEQIKQAASEYAENKAYPSEKAFVAGAEWADQHQPSPWISVEDRLPKNSKYDWVLAQIQEDNGYMWIPRVCEYIENINDWYVPDVGLLKEITKLEDREVFRVTHWMPIPPIKKGGEK